MRGKGERLPVGSPLEKTNAISGGLVSVYLLLVYEVRTYVVKCSTPNYDMVCGNQVVKECQKILKTMPLTEIGKRSKSSAEIRFINRSSKISMPEEKRTVYVSVGRRTGKAVGQAPVARGQETCDSAGGSICQMSDTRISEGYDTNGG